MAQMVKCLAYNVGDLVRSLGREDPLEKEMATHSSTLAWKIPWTEEHDGLQSTGSQRVRYDWATSIHFTSLHYCVRYHFPPNLSVPLHTVFTSLVLPELNPTWASQENYINGEVNSMPLKQTNLSYSGSINDELHLLSTYFSQVF